MKSTSKHAKLHWLVLTVLLAASTALAQGTGSISGLVQDPAGASVAHATVTAKHLATNAELKTTASESGTFEFPAAALGTYSITVEAPGFKRAVVSDVVVNVSLIASVVVKLELGAASESVTVVGESQQTINTVSPELKNVVDRRQILDLPLPGRNPIDLARLQAGLVSWHTAPYKTILSGRGTYNQYTGDNTAVPIGDAVNKIKDAIGIYRTPQGVFWLNLNLLNVSVNAATGLASGATLQAGLFTHPGAGQLGVLGPGVFKSPRFFQTDFSVLKRTKILEKTNLEFRAEFFNFFNNVNFSGAAADVNLESTQFGRITGTFDARIIQLAMRFNW